jgi:hypothetical protein
LAFKLAELVVEISGKMSGLKATMAAALSGMKRLATSAGSLGLKAGTSFAKGLSAPIRGALRALTTQLTRSILFTGLGGVLSAGGSLVFLKKAADAASDLEETVSKVGFVFGKSGQIALDAADEMADRYGIVKREFLDAAASIGLVGKASGLTQREAAQLGVNMGKLAVDASSFYNVPLEEALMAFRSGLVGEAEPMRRFGVLLSEDALKAEALALGVAKGNQELTEAQKVRARVSLITKGLKDATGDLERTQDSLANRIRKLQGQFYNLIVTVGQALMPLFQALTTALMQLAGDVQHYLDGKKAAIEAWASKLAYAVKLAGLVFRNFGDYVRLGLLKARELLEQFVAIVVRFAGRVWEQLKYGAGKAVAWLESLFEKLGGFLADLFTKVGQNIRDNIKAALNPGAFLFGKVAQVAPDMGMLKGLAPNLGARVGGDPAFAAGFNGGRRPNFLGGLLNNLPNQNNAIKPILIKLGLIQAAIEQQTGEERLARAWVQRIAPLLGGAFRRGQALFGPRAAGPNPGFNARQELLRRNEEAFKGARGKQDMLDLEARARRIRGMNAAEAQRELAAQDAHRKILEDRAARRLKKVQEGLKGLDKGIGRIAGVAGLRGVADALGARRGGQAAPGRRVMGAIPEGFESRKLGFEQLYDEIQSAILSGKKEDKQLEATKNITKALAGTENPAGGKSVISLLDSLATSMKALGLV